MSFFVVDDRFHQSRKVASLRRGDHYAQAVALWTLAGSWAKGDDSAAESGVVPLDVLVGFGIPEWDHAMKELLRVGLWVERVADDAVGFHDWDHWNGPDAKTNRLEQRRLADRVRQQNRRSQGLVTNSSRDQGVTKAEVSRDSHVTQWIGEVVSTPLTSPKKNSPSSSVKPTREDALRLCVHLADRIEANGSKRPSITVRWLDAARLLMDLDGRTEEQVHKAIDWCQDDTFWKATVMSMPKLREKYDTLRLRAQQGPGGSRGPADIVRVNQGLAAPGAMDGDYFQTPRSTDVPE